MFLMWHFICFVFIGSRERRDLGEGRVTHLSHFKNTPISFST